MFVHIDLSLGVWRQLKLFWIYTNLRLKNYVLEAIHDIECILKIYFQKIFNYHELSYLNFSVD